MTLAEERELEVVRDGLTHVTGVCHSKDPHWHAKYRWIEASFTPEQQGSC